MGPLLLRKGGVQFVREQDGPAERLLKARLVELFERGNIRRAYLAQISLDGQSGVALCLSGKNPPDSQLVSAIGVIFGAIFVTTDHLDILFLNDPEESALSAVCAPFYSAISAT